MANKLVLRFALLLSLGASMMMSVSAQSDSSESKEQTSSSIESAEVKKKGDGSATTAAPSKADAKAIDKLALGHFRLTSDPKEDDFNAFLKAMEFKKEDRNRIRNAPNIDVIMRRIHKGKYNIKVLAGFITLKDVTFRLGKEYNDKMLDGRTYKGTATFEGKDKMIVDEKHAGFNCRNMFQFAKNEFTASLECNGVKATQEFEKFKQQKLPSSPFKLEFGK